MPHITGNNEADLKVSILGAAGGIGQSLSLLVKTQLQVLAGSADKNLKLALFDVNKDAVNGVGTDLSHIDTQVEVSMHNPQEGDGINSCLKGADIVVIPAGVPRKPGMTRDDLFNINANIITQLTDSILENCDLTRVVVLLISNPVNSLVPVMVNRMSQKVNHKNTGIEKRVFGVTNLDLVRASTFLREVSEDKIEKMPYVPVIGGHSGETIIPLFSQNPHSKAVPSEKLGPLVHRVQYGGDEVVKAKNGAGSATLSMAHAGFQCVVKFAKLFLGGEKEFKGTYYISLKDFNNQPIAKNADALLPLVNNVPFFALPMTLTLDGVQSVDSDIIENMNIHERKELLPICLDQLEKNIAKGLDFSA